MRKFKAVSIFGLGRPFFGLALNAHRDRRPVLDTGLGFAFLNKLLNINAMEKGCWVYIMANRYRGGMYVGVTADLAGRVSNHRNGTGSVHVRDFGKRLLVYVERHEDIGQAIAREKLIKKWRREWKFALIEAANHDWNDLWEEYFGPDTADK